MNLVPRIKNNTVILSLEEYENLKNSSETKDKVIKDLKSVIKDKGRIIVTRYDINPTPSVQKMFVDYILETYERLVGNPINRIYEIDSYSERLTKYGSAAYDINEEIKEVNRRKECMKKAVESFVNKHLSTTSKADYSKETSKVINFEDIENEIKEIYNHKYFEEFGERILKLQNDEKEYKEKLEKLNQNSIIKSYKERFEEIEDNLTSVNLKVKSQETLIDNLNDKIRDLERKIRDKDSQLELYRTTIEDQKSLREYNNGNYKFENI